MGLFAEYLESGFYPTQATRYGKLYKIKDKENY